MAIKCYLLSSRIRQINHTYYSLDDDTDVELFYNLDECTHELYNIMRKTFVYEVEVQPEDIFECDKHYLKATSFKIIELVDLKSIISLLNFSSQTLKEIYRIFNGEASKAELVYTYKKAVQGAIQWTDIEQIKFLAIISQTRIELPPVIISNSFGMSLIRLLEFYNRPYQVDPLSYNSGYLLNRAICEALKGRNKFEYIENEDCEILMYDMTSFLKLVATRKLTQNQFEYCCMYSPFLTTADKKKFVNTALRANYEIPHEGRHLFFPEIIFKHESWVTELKTKYLDNDYARARLLLLGYKLKDYNYHHSYWATNIENARRIFKNENYQYIELDD